MSAIRYYRCTTCNLTFKNHVSAIDHKAATLHGDIEEEHFASRYDVFPPAEPLNEGVSAKAPAFVEASIGEPAEPLEIREFYVCLTCRLTFKSRAGAADHKSATLHRVVRENYPVGPPRPSFWKLSEIRGSNTDYDAFFQRTLDDVPNEN